MRADDTSATHALIEAALTGLRTIPTSQDLEGMLLRSLADEESKSTIALTPERVRDIAARQLRDAVDWQFEHGDLARRLRKAAAATAKELGHPSDLDDMVVCAFMMLDKVIERYRAGTAQFGGPDPDLFPVRDDFWGWAQIYARKCAHNYNEMRRKARLGIAAEHDPSKSQSSTGYEVSSSDASALTPTLGRMFRTARGAIQTGTEALSPDLRARNPNRSTERWAAIIRAAGLEALNLIQRFLLDRTQRSGMNVGPVSSDTIRGQIHDLELSALDQAVKRMKADHAYAVAKALWMALGITEGSPAASKEVGAAEAVRVAAYQWHFAQLPLVAHLLFETLVAQVSSARTLARSAWSAELVASVGLVTTPPDPRLLGDPAEEAATWLAATVQDGRTRVDTARHISAAPVVGADNSRQVSAEALLRLHRVVSSVELEARQPS